MKPDPAWQFVALFFGVIGVLLSAQGLFGHYAIYLLIGPSLIAIAFGINYLNKKVG